MDWWLFAIGNSCVHVCGRELLVEQLNVVVVGGYTLSQVFAHNAPNPGKLTPTICT
jgi:hypothetical protein